MSMYAYLMSQFANDAARTAAAERQDAMALPQAADTLRAAAERSRAQIEAARDKAWERGRQMKLDDLVLRQGEQGLQAGEENLRHARAVNPLKEEEAGVNLGVAKRRATEDEQTSAGRVEATNATNEFTTAKAKGEMEQLPEDLKAHARTRDLGLLKAERQEKLGAQYDEAGIKADLANKKSQTAMHYASAAYQGAHAKEMNARAAALDQPDSPELGPRVKIRDISDRMQRLTNAWKAEAAASAAAMQPFTKPMPTEDDARTSIAADLGKDIRFGQGEAFKPAQDPAILALAQKAPGTRAYTSPSGKLMLVPPDGRPPVIVPGTNVKSVQQDAAAAQPGAPITGPRPAAGRPKVNLSNLFGNDPNFPEF